MSDSHGNHNPPEYSVKIAKSVQEVEELRGIWEKMQWHPNGDIDHYLTVVGSRPNILNPYVILISRNGSPSMLVIGRIEDYSFDCRFGYKSIYKPVVRSMIIIYGGILGEGSLDDYVFLVSQLKAMLRRREANLIMIASVRTDSALYNLTRSSENFLFRDHCVVENYHWRASLHDSYEKFYNSRSQNTKHNIRKWPKRLIKEFGNRLIVKCFCKEEELETIMRDSEKVASKTYQRGMEVGFVDNAETRRLMNVALQRQWLRAYVLYLDNEPCAFWNGLRYGKIFYGYNNGYDPAYRDYRPGHFVLMKMIEDLCNAKDTEYVDFGFGDAEYKRELCDQKWAEASIIIFPLTFYGFKLNFMRTITAISYKLSINVLKKLKLLEKVKKTWRNRLRPKTELAP
jgi:hypothetical protein